ncbi:MAG: DinB family protein [Actinobacteria bacterium]|nr:DinB family protein [Actinomycetota bacterium]
MTESQREPVPRNDESEFGTAMGFLDFARRAVLKKLDGLSEEQTRRSIVPTGTTLLGLVNHLVDGERYWFRVHLLGEGTEPDWDAHMSADPRDSLDEVRARYQEAIADANAAINRLGRLDARSVGEVDGRPTTLRWTIAHMTSETARHAGHADILRELIDGVTGR